MSIFYVRIRRKYLLLCAFEKFHFENTLFAVKLTWLGVITVIFPFYKDAVYWNLV